MMQLLRSLGEQVFTLGVTLLLQSTVLLAIGLVVARALRSRGPILASYLYRGLWVGVLLLLPLHVWFLRMTPPAVVVPVGTMMETKVYQRVPQALAPVDSATGTYPTTPSKGWPYPAPAETLSDAKAVAYSSASIIGLIWLIFALAQVIWLGFSHYQLVVLRRRSRPVADSEAMGLLRTLAQNSFMLVPELRESELVSGPLLAGAAHPVIYLKQDAPLTVDLMETALIHELAHIRAADCAWTVVRRLGCALFWPQPLLWVLAKLSWQVSEEAADQSVIQAGQSFESYARSLLSLAEAGMTPHVLRGFSAGVVESRSSVGRRIERLLDSPQRMLRSISRPVRIWCLGCVSALLLASGCSVMLRDGSGQIAPTSAPDWPARPVKHWPVPGGYASHFSLARQKGWSMQPVQYVEWGPGKILSDSGNEIALPNLTSAQKQELDRANAFDGLLRTGSSKTKSLLRKFPHDPFLHYQEAAWAKRGGDQAGYLSNNQIALKNAKVILAGRIQYEDGRPLTGNRFISMSFSRESRPRTSDAAPIQVYYPVTLDEDGCYYLPFLEGEWTQMSLAYDQIATPSHQDVVLTRIEPRGGIVISGAHVQLLPPIVARPTMTGLHFQGVADGELGTLEKPILIKSGGLGLQWTPFKGAAYYTIELQQYLLHSNGNREATMLEIPQDFGRTDVAKIEVPSNSRRLIFRRDRIYAANICARPKEFEAGNEQMLSMSQTVFFKVLDGLGPIEMSKTNIVKVLPRGFSFVKLVTSPKGASLTLKSDLEENETAKALMELRQTFKSFAGYGEPTGKNIYTRGDGVHMFEFKKEKG